MRVKYILIIICLMATATSLPAQNTHTTNNNIEPGQTVKLPMEPDGIIRLSRVEVYPEYIDEYLDMAAEVGRISLITEPGVLTMYALAEKEHPCIITILETYASQEAYRSHIASEHFQKYKRGTLHMVKDLRLVDQTEINRVNRIINFISE